MNRAFYNAADLCQLAASLLDRPGYPIYVRALDWASGRLRNIAVRL